jgi:hypothetical protein
MNTDATSTTTTTTGDAANTGDAATKTAAAATNSTATIASTPGDGKGTETPAKEGGDRATTEATKAGDKPAEAKPDADKSKETKEGDKAKGPPEKYEFKMPEGIVLEGENQQMLEEVARENGWTQAQAQGVADKLASWLQRNAATQEAMVAKNIEAWGEESKAALGKDYDENVANARKAVAAVNDPQLLADFNELGWGNRLSLVKAFAFFGKLVGGDSLVGISDKTEARTARTPAEVLYGGNKTP